MPSASRPDQAIYLGGEWIKTDESIVVRSPYDGRELAAVGVAQPADVASAIDAAETAMRRPFAAHQRAAVLERTAAALIERQAEFAEIVSAEAGKPIRAAATEVLRAASTFRHAAAETLTLAGTVIPMDASEAGVGRIGFTLRRPVGILAAISPFNFPLNLVAHKLAPAFGAGCAVVLKPASQTPLCAQLLAEVLAEAGLPEGMLSVLTGRASEIGDVLVADDRVKALSFTGSSGVGWALRGRAPKKKVFLELGNATPAIVLADADIESAAAVLSASAFSNAGQSCISVQRIFVQDEIAERFVELFVQHVERLGVGDPALQSTDVGPVIDRANRDRILSWIASSGGAVMTGGTLNSDGVLLPTVILDPEQTSDVCQREVFGPVCAIIRVPGLDVAIERSNETDYGLQAGVFTSNIDHALTAAARLEFGGVLINEAPTFRVDHMPYGGVKDSGNTREGPHYAIREMSEEHLVIVNQRSV
jgi:acyl-CoA reductase-like NAD-dependent aldehyde dehydrogenase